MWRDIASSNAENLSQALAAVERSLSRLRADLRSPLLQGHFERAADFAQRIRERNDAAGG